MQCSEVRITSEHCLSFGASYCSASSWWSKNAQRIQCFPYSYVLKNLFEIGFSLSPFLNQLNLTFWYNFPPISVLERLNCTMYIYVHRVRPRNNGEYWERTRASSRTGWIRTLLLNMYLYLYCWVIMYFVQSSETQLSFVIGHLSWICRIPSSLALALALAGTPAPPALLRPDLRCFPITMYYSIITLLSNDYSQHPLLVVT